MFAYICVCKIYLDSEMWIGWLAIYDEQSKTTSKVKVKFSEWTHFWINVCLRSYVVKYTYVCVFAVNQLKFM